MSAKKGEIYKYIANPAAIKPFSCRTAHGQWCPGIRLTMEGFRGLNKITHIKPSESVTGQSPGSTISHCYITSHGCHSNRMRGTLWEKQIGSMNQSKIEHWEISFRNETQTVFKTIIFFGDNFKCLIFKKKLKVFFLYFFNQLDFFIFFPSKVIKKSSRFGIFYLCVSFISLVWYRSKFIQKHFTFILLSWALHMPPTPLHCSWAPTLSISHIQ